MHTSTEGETWVFPFHSGLDEDDCFSLSLSGPPGLTVWLVPSLIFSRLILDGAPLIAIHKARYYKKKDGLALGPGPFVTGLEYATDRQATVVGKPEQTFFLEALRGTNCMPEEAVMIGDVST